MKKVLLVSMLCALVCIAIAYADDYFHWDQDADNLDLQTDYYGNVWWYDDDVQPNVLTYSARFYGHDAYMITEYTAGTLYIKSGTLGTKLVDEEVYYNHYLTTTTKGTNAASVKAYWTFDDHSGYKKLN